MLPAVVLSAKVTIDGLNKANSELSAYNKQWEKVAGTVEAAGVSIDNTHKKIDQLRAATSAPIDVDINVHFDDLAFEEFAIKKHIAEDPAITTLKAKVEDLGFEEGGIKKHIFSEPVTTTLFAEIDEASFAAAEARVASLGRPTIAPVITVAMGGSGGGAGGVGGTSEAGAFSAASLTKNMTQIRQWDRGHPNFFSSTGSSAGSNDIQKLIQMMQVMTAGRGGSRPNSDASGFGIDAAQLFTGHSGGGGGRSVLPWWGRLATGGGRLPGAGSLGSFAGFGAEHFALSLGGVLGSGLAATAGGGLLAAGTAGKIAVGAGSDALVSAATIAGTKEITEAQTKWNEAIKQYGYYSTQARTAQKNFNEAMREAGPAGKAELQLGEHAKHLEKLFKNESAPARKQSAMLLGQGLDVAEAFVPKISNAADENFKIINKDIKPLFKWLEGPQGMGIFDTLENKFKEDLPTSIHAFTQAIEFILKTVADASKFTGGFTESLDKFFTKWNEPQNFSIWEEHIENLIEDFHLWMGFLKDVGKLLMDIFSNDAHTGSAIVIALDEMINKADAWVNSTEGSGQLHNIFQIHKEEIIALLKIIPPMVTLFRQVYMQVAPPLVAAATAVLGIIARILVAFTETGPIAKWALGIAVITTKMGLLKPVLAWLWAQMGLLPAKLTAQEVSNDKLVASNEALATSNADLAASFEAVTAAATDSSVASEIGSVGAPARSVRSAQSMEQLFPEAIPPNGQMSLFGTAPKNAITKDAEQVAGSGRSMATGLMSSFAAAIPAAAAAYGVVNLLTSVVSGGKNHLKEAGFEAGGSIVGGLAGFFVGGPVGAMLGVGLGSLGGELLSKLFESSPKHPFAERLEAEVRSAKSADSLFKNALSGMESAEKKLAQDRSGNRKTTVAMHEAEKNLNEVVKKYGPISEQAHEAEKELSEIRKENQEHTEAWASVQELSKVKQEEAIAVSKEVINNDKTLIPGLREKIENAKEYERENGKTTETTKKVAEAEEELVNTQKKLHEAFKVLKQLQPELAAQYHNMTDGQHKWGKDYIALLPQMSAATTTMAQKHELALLRAGHQTGNFSVEVQEAMEASEKSIESMSGNGVSNIGVLMDTLSSSLQELGISPIKFHGKKNRIAQHQGHTGRGKQTGGMVVPGGGSGDSVPLTAMVEPGEIVHVLNRSASKKLGQLEALNKSVPRFQEGGAMGGYVYPFSPGISWGRIDQGQDMAGSGPIAAIGDAQVIAGSQGGWPGTGDGLVYQLLNGPRSGQDIYVYENVKRTVGIGSKVSAGQTIADLLPAYPHLEMGFSDPSGTPLANPEYVGKEDGTETKYGKEMHAFLEALASGGGKAIFSGAGGNMGALGATVKKIGEPKVEGPAGMLKELDQGVTHKATMAVNQFLKEQVGSMSGGKFTEIAGNNAVEAAGKTLLANGLNRIGASGILGNAWQESGWDPGAVGSGGGGFLGFTAGEISLAALEHAAEVKGKAWKDPSFQMAFALEHISGSIISGLNASKSPGDAARFFMEEWEHPAVATENLANREAGAEKAFSMGLQKGGTVEHPIKVIEEIVQGAGAKKPAPVVKAQAKVKPLLHTIEGIGIKGPQLNRLAALTTDEEKYGEYATNAEALDKTVQAPAKEIEKLEKEGKPTEWLVQGKSNGKNDGQWLNMKLGSLVTLHNQLVKAHEVVAGKKAYVVKIFKSSKKQLDEVMKNIRQAESHKRDVEKKIHEFEKEVTKLEQEIKTIELAKNQNTKQLEKEQKQLEHDLTKAENQKQTAAVHAQEQSLREQIRDKQHAINNTGAVSHESVKALNEQINDTNKKIHGDQKAVKEIERNVTRFQRQETTLDEVIPTLESQREGLEQTEYGIYSSGGSVGNQNFVGLQTVQGLGGSLGHWGHAPAMNEVGGEVFATEQQLQSIDEALHPHIEAITETESEAREKPMREMEAAMALAELTPGSEDNMKILEQEKAFESRRLGEAQASGNLEEIIQWADALKGTEEAITGGSGTSQKAEELLRIQEELNVTLEKENTALKAETPVMAKFASVSAIANAGGFAKGGMVAATVGENGVETLLVPNGSNVVSNAERRSVVADARSQRANINFEEVHFHEAEGRVSGKANGEPFDQQVDSINRDTVRQASWGRTPGGSRDRT
jgi:hypothetical protein